MYNRKVEGKNRVVVKCLDVRYIHKKIHLLNGHRKEGGKDGGKDAIKFWGYSDSLLVIHNNFFVRS